MPIQLSIQARLAHTSGSQYLMWGKAKTPCPFYFVPERWSAWHVYEHKSVTAQYAIAGGAKYVLFFLTPHVRGFMKKYEDFAKYACYFLQSMLCLYCKVNFAILKGGEPLLTTRIKELRKERKLSQEELALAVGTTRQTITSIETGKYIASLPLAYKIAHHFSLPIEEVFDLSEYTQQES